MILKNLTLLIVLAPLVGSLVAGIFGKNIGRRGARWVTILGVAISFVASLYVFKLVIFDHLSFNGAFYSWIQSGNFNFSVGFLVDHLTALMMVVVTFVSLLVHIYTIGYMADDPGYQRFFSYMSAFTFAMLILVAANNFALMFFGWEGVGLISYLLIGFWFHKESAVQGSLKAFLVNRVGDVGFLLGMAALVDNLGTLDYQTVFAHTTLLSPHAVTLICILLFIGAMGKSAQMPLHVWLPESMEGPTPISALIHAATMVTAGVYMLARLSPLYVLSPTALAVVLIIGATTALFMGLVALVQNDIKRVIAYSTISQLGYMVAACGATAFSAGIFHLVTHACFKALLFLAAGSVIIALHHEQDLRKMGGLWRYLPLTYITFLVGSLALSAIPPFAGFYSKDAIIDAVHQSTVLGSHYAYICLLLGAFVTALYTFRAFFMAFHGSEKTPHHAHESPTVMTVPLIVLAVASLFVGVLLVQPFVHLNPYTMTIDACLSWPFWLSVSGIVIAWFSYVKYPNLPIIISERFAIFYRILIEKYGFDALNNLVFVRGGQALSRFFYYVTDLKLIDGWMVNGSGRGINRISKLMRRLQSGYLYHYVFAMILGLVLFLAWTLLR